MSDQPTPEHPVSSDDKLYTDEHGVPLLFDVVVPGDVAKARGISLRQDQRENPVNTGPLNLELRIRAAIDAALPKVTEQTAAAMREALEKEVRASLTENDDQTAPGDQSGNERRG